MIRILLLVSALLAGPATAAEWVEIDDSDGVRTFKQAVEGSSLLGFRGLGTVDVHISLLLGLFLDESKCTDWIDLLAECDVTRDIDDQSQVVYQRYDISWPVSDRDYVLRRTITFDPDTRTVDIVFESMEDDAIPPRQGVVRATVMRTFWRMRALDGGRTEIDSEAFTDPKGAIPAWVVNLVQRQWARKSINDMVVHATAEGVVPYEDIADW